MGRRQQEENGTGDRCSCSTWVASFIDWTVLHFYLSLSSPGWQYPAKLHPTICWSLISASMTRVVLQVWHRLMFAALICTLPYHIAWHGVIWSNETKFTFDVGLSTVRLNMNPNLVTTKVSWFPWTRNAFMGMPTYPNRNTTKLTIKYFLMPDYCWPMTEPIGVRIF